VKSERFPNGVTHLLDRKRDQVKNRERVSIRKKWKPLSKAASHRPITTV
jgi:hypothetical protein